MLHMSLINDPRVQLEAVKVIAFLSDFGSIVLVHLCDPQNHSILDYIKKELSIR